MTRKRDMATIPQPMASIASLQQTAVATKELVEVMTGQRGSPHEVAVTWGDLIELGLIQPEQVPTDIGSNPSQ